MQPDTVNFFSMVVVPLATAVIGWLGSSYRNKQRKEGDMLENFRQMMSIQNDFIAGLKTNIDERDDALVDAKRVNQRLEAKLDKKEKSIRKANLCKFSNEGDGCPVLLQEDKNCDNCEHRDNDKSEN